MKLRIPVQAFNSCQNFSIIPLLNRNLVSSIFPEIFSLLQNKIEHKDLEMKELYSFVQWARLCLRTNNEDDVMKIFSFLGKMSVDLVQMKNTISQSEESEIILGTFTSEFTYSIRKEFLKSKNDFSTGAYYKCFQSILKSILNSPESLNEAQDGFKLISTSVRM